MSELRERLEQLAERGTRRGADAVLGAALAELERAAADATTNGHRAVTSASAVSEPLEVLDSVDAEPDDDDVVVPAVSMEEARLARTRRPWRSALTAAGLAALLGVGTLGISSLLSDGGAESPEGAVRQLADAIDAEDPLAAVDVLAPAEVRGLRDAVEGAARRAQELRLVNDAASPLAGVDLEVHDLELTSEELAPGIAKVTVHAGRIDSEARRDGLSNLIQRAWDRSGDAVVRGRLDVADVDVDVQPFVVAVEDGDGWYVSPAYTALEWIRVVNDLPPADFGSGVEAAGGADTPEAAVEGALEALAADDWDRLWGYAPPSELPLYDYRDALRELIGDSSADVTVDELSAQAEVDGDVALVTVTASGTYPDGGRWTADAECIRFADPGAHAPGDGCADAEYDRYGSFFGLVGVNGDGEVTSVASVPITVVQRDGRWYVSPIATVTDAVAAGVDRIDERYVYSFLGLEEMLPADGELALGREVNLPARTSYASVYEFDGRAGQRVVGVTAADDAPTDENWFGFASGVIVGPDGEEVPDSHGVLENMVVELPQDGRYRLIVRPYQRFHVRFTLYDAESAPEAVLNPPDPCAADSAPAWCVPPEVVSRECTEGGVAVDCDARPGPGVEREICERWDDGNRSCFTEAYDVSVGDEPGAPGVEAPNEGWAPAPPEGGG